MLSNILVVISSLLLISVWCFLPLVMPLWKPLSIFLYLMILSHLRVLSVHFCDANWGPQDASLPKSDLSLRPVSIHETKSICSHVLFMAGAPVKWFTHKVKCSSHSTCKAEIKATDECVKSVQQFRNLLAELGLLNSLGSTPIFNDNRGAVLIEVIHLLLKVFAI
jgi:hypothetical protein